MDGTVFVILAYGITGLVLLSLSVSSMVHARRVARQLSVSAHHES